MFTKILAVVSLCVILPSLSYSSEPDYFLRLKFQESAPIQKEIKRLAKAGFTPAEIPNVAILQGQVTSGRNSKSGYNSSSATYLITWAFQDVNNLGPFKVIAAVMKWEESMGGPIGRATITRVISDATFLPYCEILMESAH
jgi:hypothetical protein